jgi:hypothetical protein
MDNQICSTCNQPLKLIPAGVSKKTGRPYTAFWTCPNRCPQPSPRAPQSNPSGFQPKQVETPNWDKISFGKCKYGFLLEAFKLGANLQTAEKEAEEWATAAMRKLEQPRVVNYGTPEIPDEYADQVPY